MATENTIRVLHYQESPNFLRCDRGNFDRVTNYAHIFRKAVDKCGLQGVYVLRDHSENAGESIVPVVYVCKVNSEDKADDIHRLVWNQNIVPFLIVETPQKVKLYSGFHYDRSSTGKPDEQGVLEAAIAFNQIASRLQDFQASSIDDGTVWKTWGQKVTPETRVDWKLLGNLQKLDLQLRNDGLDKNTSHALIGKFIYLSYLKDRNILSPRKLDRWDIEYDCIFSRNATLKSFQKLMEKLDDWLNGEIFPLSALSFKKEHLRRVASTFFGDEPDGQPVFFQAYDFSHIPIETLSVIYEQFLHTPDPDDKPTKGRESGAYYTPIPLVNFMLTELHDQHPLKQGMKVLDPSCGSGAFLVQCYRHLIEGCLKDGKPFLKPSVLRDLLEKHIYGVDRDSDACRVAELSLILTLLDYVDPPDLESTPRFQLPTLRNKNIFEADFFDPASNWTKTSARIKFDWIVGNPPWISLSSRNKKIFTENRHVWKWIRDNAVEHPIGGNQVAEAFSWKVVPHVAFGGVIGLLMPAMTLFKDESTEFRQKLFQQMQVWCVANFANLAYVLFSGRSELPAASFFYQNRPDKSYADNEHTLVYSPFVANQLANRPLRARKKLHTWNIVINASEVREISTRQAVTGNMLPWKLAMWGSPYDGEVLRKTRNQFPLLKQFEDNEDIIIAEGPKKKNLPVTFLGKDTLNTKNLRNCGRIFCFCKDTLEKIPHDEMRRPSESKSKGLKVGFPPHIVVDGSRRFSVYSDNEIIIPSRYIGISGDKKMSSFLKALSLYLNSDFAIYHQYLLSPEPGIHSTRSTLNALRQLPVPFDHPALLKQWSDLRQTIVDIAQKTHMPTKKFQLKNDSKRNDTLAPLMAELNAEVYKLLKLRDFEKALVEDFVNIRIKLAKGKVSEDARNGPTKKDQNTYLIRLKTKLDGFIKNHKTLQHKILAVHDTVSAMISIDLVKKNGKRIQPVVCMANSEMAGELEKTRNNLPRQHSQWVYFDRSLRIYEGTRTYLFKPMQRMLWTQSQALIDAGEIIAETLEGTGG